MVSQQGDLALLDHPVAQELLRSPLPAHLAYVRSDGAPDVVPIGFHWNGNEFVLGTFPNTVKMHALHDGDKVALSIDSDSMPYKVLRIRGNVRTDVVDGVAPEYEAMTRRTLGDEAGAGWIEQMRSITATMARIFVTPEWVCVQDFQTRFPNELERAMEAVT
ncbi:MAG TPA: pyridoxamine 5'-phosphate oxidase family protein [Thermomicrobiales bacterium]|nr:pyridoxamine 5'-phosphate oxidase family protein [Thermomicrobiales bacterium]